MKYFLKTELACRHCGLYNPHPGFEDELDALREEFGRPMNARSGCRCKEYNDSPEVKGHPKSLHIGDEPAHTDKGQQGFMALDVGTPDGEYRGALFALAWKRGWSIGWNAAKMFLHLDRRADLGMPQTSFDY